MIRCGVSMLLLGPESWKDEQAVWRCFRGECIPTRDARATDDTPLDRTGQQCL